jgi:uncharacterized protein (DUF433 family)
MSLPISTEYRYITHASEIAGGRPIIKGTRITIKAIVGYYKLGLSVEEMLEDLPNLTPAQVYEALSYYHDHQVEIESDIEASRAERLIERYGLKVAGNGRIIR